ncbi:MAG: hypothetical protein GXX99_02515 [Clostridiales bacterium]|nr:hypothetical protein [Clostridiales bacterium]
MTGLNVLLQAVVAAAIPVLTTVLISLIRAKVSQVAARTENERVGTYLAQVVHAVGTAVPAINQTYVDALKQRGSFSGAEQAAALEKAIQTAKAALSASTVDFIKQNYGDVNAYLAPKIEAEVRAQKQGPSATPAQPPAAVPAAAATAAQGSAPVGVGVCPCLPCCRRCPHAGRATAEAENPGEIGP